VRHPHILDTDSFVNVLIGFLISAAVGLTGVGGGSFTVPALAILASLPAGPAVGTAFVFAIRPTISPGPTLKRTPSTTTCAAPRTDRYRTVRFRT
jgi:uncharacterized membrane protein YfcA